MLSCYGSKFKIPFFFFLNIKNCDDNVNFFFQENVLVIFTKKLSLPEKVDIKIALSVKKIKKWNLRRWFSRKKIHLLFYQNWTFLLIPQRWHCIWKGACRLMLANVCMWMHVSHGEDGMPKSNVPLKVQNVDHGLSWTPTQAHKNIMWVQPRGGWWWWWWCWRWWWCHLRCMSRPAWGPDSESTWRRASPSRPGRRHLCTSCTKTHTHTHKPIFMAQVQLKLIWTQYFTLIGIEMSSIHSASTFLFFFCILNSKE